MRNVFGSVWIDLTPTRGGSTEDYEVLAEELAIWVIIGVALLLVGAMIRRGEAMPKIETSARENRLLAAAFLSERAPMSRRRYSELYHRLLSFTFAAIVTLFL